DAPDAAHAGAGVGRDRSDLGPPARERRDAAPARQRDAAAGTGDRAAVAPPARELRHVVDEDAEASSGLRQGDQPAVADAAAEAAGGADRADRDPGETGRDRATVADAAEERADAPHHHPGPFP